MYKLAYLKSMRVVSYVPSLTETLIEAGVNVVGRTRYCIHPGATSAIPVVGGTKDWDPEKLKALKPDLLILDKEENPKFMAENPGLRYHATHAENLRGMPKLLRELGDVLQNPKLAELAVEYEVEIEKQRRVVEPPGIIEWGGSPAGGAKKFSQIVYLIWKDPWMAVGEGTFIDSVFEHLGLRMAPLAGKYPKINVADYDPEETLFLFSSEPFPFLKRRSELASLNVRHAFVDGEKYSWFGVRNLRFLQSL